MTLYTHIKSAYEFRGSCSMNHWYFTPDSDIRDKGTSENGCPWMQGGQWKWSDPSCFSIGLSLLFLSSGAMTCWFTLEIANKDLRECIQHFLLLHTDKQTLNTFVLLNECAMQFSFDQQIGSTTDGNLHYLSATFQTHYCFWGICMPFAFTLMRKYVISVSCS